MNSYTFEHKCDACGAEREITVSIEAQFLKSVRNTFTEDEYKQCPECGGMMRLEALTPEDEKDPLGNKTYKCMNCRHGHDDESTDVL